MAWYPESALQCGPGRVRDGLCGPLGWMELGDRDLWAGTVAGWIPRNLREPPGISGLDVGGGQGQQVRTPGSRIPGSSVGPPGTQMVQRGHVCHPKDQPATERSWCEIKGRSQELVQDSRARVFAHLPEIGLPLLASGGQPCSGHPGMGVGGW